MCRFISSQLFESWIFLEQFRESIIYFLTESQPSITLTLSDHMSQHNKSFQKSSSQKALSIKSNAEKILLQKPAIDVLSDQQQQDIINDRYQQEIFQNKIQQAVLTKSKYNVLKVLYVQLNFKGKSERQKQKRWNNIIKGFIARNLNTQAGQPYDIKHSFFNQKMVSNPSDQYIQNEYILYGCDILSHKHIQKIFSPFNPTIKWINSSHCKLTFMQKNQGWQAVINNCKDVSSFLKDMQQNLKVQTLLTNLHLQSQSQSHPNHQSQQQILTQQKQQQKKLKYRQQFLKFQKLKKKYVLLKKYVQLSPYYELGFKRRLMIRNVTKSEQLMGYNIKVHDKDKQEKQIKPNLQKEQGQQENQIFTEQAQRQNNLNSTNQRRLSQENVNLNNKSISKQGTSDYKKFIKIKQDFWKDIQENQLVKPEYQKVMLKQQQQQQIIRLKGKQPSNRGAHNNNYANNRQRSDYGPRQYNENFRASSGRGGFYRNFNRISDRNGTWNGQNNVNTHQYRQNDHRTFDRINEQYPQQQSQRIRSREHYPQQNYQRGRGGYHGRGGYRNSRDNFNNDRNGYSNNINYRDKRFRKWDQAERDFDSYVEQREGLKMIQKPHQNCQLAFVDQKTGIHFYKNPLYDPSTQYNLQPYNTYIQGRDTGYPIQASLPGQSQSISYEYGGNSANLNNYNQQMQYQQGTYQQSHFSRKMNPHYLNQNPNFMPQQNFAYRPQQPLPQYKQKPVAHKLQTSQQQFQKYVANRKQAPQLQDPNCSVINDAQKNLHNNEINFENSNNNPSGAHENLGNWNKILDNIHSDDQNDQGENQRDFRIIGMGDNRNLQRNNKPQTHDDDDDSSNLDFLLESREEKPQQTNIKKQPQLKQEYISMALTNVVYQQLPRQQLPTWLNSNLGQKSIDHTRELDNFTNGNNILTNSQTMSQNSNKNLRKQKESILQARTQGPSIKMKKIRNQSEKKRIPKKKKETTLGLFRKG